MKFRFTFIQNVKGQWWGMPMEMIEEAPDLATAITMAWVRETKKGVDIKDFRV